MMAKSTQSQFAKGNIVKVKVGDEILEAEILRSFPYALDVRFLSDNTTERIKRTMVVSDEPIPNAPKTARGMAAAPDLPSAYQNHHILARETETADEAASYVLSDDWSGQIERGDPFKEAAQPYVEANPDKQFRYLGQSTMRRHGDRDYRRVKGPDGKPVTVGGMELAYIPKHVYNERRRRIDEQTDREANLRIEQHKEEMERAMVDSRGGLNIITSSITNSIRDGGMRTTDEQRNVARAMFELQD